MANITTSHSKGHIVAWIELLWSMPTIEFLPTCFSLLPVSTSTLQAVFLFLFYSTGTLSSSLLYQIKRSTTHRPRAASRPAPHSTTTELLIPEYFHHLIYSLMCFFASMCTFDQHGRWILDLLLQHTTTATPRRLALVCCRCTPTKSATLLAMRRSWQWHDTPQSPTSCRSQTLYCISHSFICLLHRTAAHELLGLHLHHARSSSELIPRPLFF